MIGDELSQLSVSFGDEIVEVLLIHSNNEEDDKGDKEPDVSYAEEAPVMVPFLLRVDQFRKLKEREKGEERERDNTEVQCICSQKAILTTMRSGQT